LAKKPTGPEAEWTSVKESAPGAPVPPNQGEPGPTVAAKPKKNADVAKSPESVPPEIETPLVLVNDEEIPEVVGMQREVAVETTPEALNVEHSEPASTGSVETETSTKQVSAKEVEMVEKQKNDTSDTSDTSDTREPRGTTVGPDPETQKLSDLEQDEQGEQGDADTEGRDLHAHCGKETQDFQRARVHQVFNILEDDVSRTRGDSSPNVLEVWKVEPQDSPLPESPRQGQCHVM